MLTTPEAIRQVQASIGRGQTTWIGIDGLSCAGKTTFAGALAAALGGATVIQGDDLALPSGDPWDHERFAEQVYGPLQAGLPARYQRRHWTNKEYADWVDVPPGVVIVEGIRTFAAEVPLPWDLRIWLEVPEAVRLDRARRRDGGARWACWSENWLPKEQEYLDTQRPAARADLLVSGLPELAGLPQPA